MFSGLKINQTPVQSHLALLFSLNETTLTHRPVQSAELQSSSLFSTSWFFKELKVESDNNLPCGNLVEQQPLCDWSLGTLILFDFSQPDLRPSQEVCWRTR